MKKNYSNKTGRSQNEFIAALLSMATACIFTVAAHAAAPAPVESLSSVDPDAAHAWSFYAAEADEHRITAYTPLVPVTDAANNVMVKQKGEGTVPPFMLWQLGNAAGPVTVRPESDLHSPDHKGDLIAMWKVTQKGRYQVRVEVKNIGTDVRGGDGGAVIISHLGAQEKEDTQLVERIAVPASGPESPHVQRVLTIEASAGNSIVLRVNAGIDGFADQWQVQYSIARSDA